MIWYVKIDRQEGVIAGGWYFSQSRRLVVKNEIYEIIDGVVKSRILRYPVIPAQVGMTARETFYKFINH